ncbi:hypothetical protein NNG48_07275 [Enterococcus faecium]|nr:hypothetical protein [Enterococcus faecium]
MKLIDLIGTLSPGVAVEVQEEGVYYGTFEPCLLERTFSNKLDYDVVEINYSEECIKATIEKPVASKTWYVEVECTDGTNVSLAFTTDDALDAVKTMVNVLKQKEKRDVAVITVTE